MPNQPRRRAYNDPRYLRARAELKQRDHVCHRCGLDIDMRLSWPHPLSWSCGHIVAVSLLTDRDDPRHWHVSNLRAEHLRCNESGGATSPRRPVPPLPWATD